MKIDLDLINKIRKPFYDHNYKCCPVDNIRLDLRVEKHFVERLIHRFKNNEIKLFMKDIFDWIDTNYCMMLFETHIGAMKTYRVEMKTGTVVIGLYDNTLRVRTCFKGGEDDPD